MSIRLACPTHGRIPKFRHIGYFEMIAAGGNSKGLGMSGCDKTPKPKEEEGE